MKRRILLPLFLLIVLPCLCLGQKEAPAASNRIVTALSPPGFELWTYQDQNKTFVKTWASRPLICDPSYFEAHKSQGFLPFNFLPPPSTPFPSLPISTETVKTILSL